MTKRVKEVIKKTKVYIQTRVS